MLPMRLLIQSLVVIFSILSGLMFALEAMEPQVQATTQSPNNKYKIVTYDDQTKTVVEIATNTTLLTLTAAETYVTVESDDTGDYLIIQLPSGSTRKLILKSNEEAPK